MQYEDITEMIIRAAYAVHNTLGFGFLESVYERSMIIELDTAGLHVENQCPVEVLYAGKSVGQFIADLLVEDVVVVELKSVHSVAKTHEQQLVNYLTATGKDVGLLINFGPRKVEVKRKVRLLDQHKKGSAPGSPSCPSC